jgi:hypothetical protein
VLILAIGITVLGLLAILLRNNSVLPFLSNPVISVSLLIVGTSAVISILMPYADSCQDLGGLGLTQVQT